jgi:hypothetical protein
VCCVESERGSDALECVVGTAQINQFTISFLSAARLQQQAQQLLLIETLHPTMWNLAWAIKLKISPVVSIAQREKLAYGCTLENYAEINKKENY